jgi:hypothetical protein
MNYEDTLKSFEEKLNKTIETIDAWVDLDFDNEVCLDGYFTSSQLRRIADMIEQLKEIKEKNINEISNKSRTI